MASQFHELFTRLSQFQESGRFSDFKLHCGLYTFNAHKLLLASCSKYFEVLCGGSFVEATQQFAKIDANPVMVARMLQVLYSGDYGTFDHEVALSSMLDGARNDGTSLGLLDHPGWSEKITLATHAQMYALADEYDIPALKDFARAKFITEIQDEEMDFAELITAIEIVYATTPACDDGLRKWVVFTAQAHKMTLNGMPAFEELMKSDADFSWDFGTKYTSRTQVWCADCVTWSKIPTTCTCGFNGLCGSKLCAELDWNMLKCAGCKKSGHLLREEPREEDDVCIVGVKRSCEAVERGEKAKKAKKARKARK